MKSKLAKPFIALYAWVMVTYLEWQLSHLYEQYHDSFLENITEARDNQALPRITQDIQNRFNKLLKKRSGFLPETTWKPMGNAVSPFSRPDTDCQPQAIDESG